MRVQLLIGTLQRQHSTHTQTHKQGSQITHREAMLGQGRASGRVPARPGLSIRSR